MATVAATVGSREARRRRIVERGADRLALITGRIQSLPPDPDPDESRSSESLAGRTPAVVSQPENAASNSDQESSQPHISDEAKEPLLENSDKGKTVSSTPVAPPDVEEEQSQISEEQSRIKSQSTQISSQVHQIKHSHRSSFTAGHISSAISASENTRMCFSVAVAILVVMGCCIVRTTVIFKPFYLLLLTNISIVFAWMILGTSAPKVRTGPKFSGNDVVDQMGKALESGLLLQKIFEATLMDFGIYAVVLVCGRSFVRVLGW